MVNGKPLVRDRRALTLDQAAIRARAQEYAQRIRASLP
jgi:hypothetical protein